MKIDLPGDIDTLLTRGLAPRRAGESHNVASRSACVNVLEVCPQLAQRSDIYPRVLEMLFDRQALGYRRTAARILHQIGDPLGILHLTYNALTTHPLLGVRQDNISGWSQVSLLRRASALTEECVELLLRDLQTPAGLLHVDVLAALPSQTIIPHMHALLAETSNARAAGAYILALHQQEEGRAVLEELAESQTRIELALIALSHIPDARTFEYLRRYANSDHPFYTKYPNGVSLKVLRQAQLRLFVLEHATADGVARTMERFFMHSIRELMAYAREPTLRNLADAKYSDSPLRPDWEQVASHWLATPRDFDASFLVADSHLTSGSLGTAISAVDFLCEFSGAADRTHFADAQRRSIRALLAAASLNGNGKDWGIAPNFLFELAPTGREYGLRDYYLPGVTVTYEPPDYEQAAAQWILEPQKHRFGSYTSLVY